MPKKLLSLVLIFSIIVLSIVPAHAIENYGITADWTYNAIITYEALSELAAQVAADIADGNCPAQFQGSHVDMRYNGTYWHIKVIDVNDNVYYVGAHTGTVTGGTGTVYVATASQITQVLWNIESKVNDLYTSVSAMLANTTHISLNTDAIYTRLGQAYTELINIESDVSYLPLIDNVLRTIKNDTTYLSTIETDIRNLESTVSTQFSNVVTGQNNLYNLELSMAQLLSTTNNTLSAILGKMPAQLSLDCVATSGTPYITLPYNVAVNMVSEINNKYIGSEFTIYTRNNHTVEGTYILDYANLESGEGGTRMYIKLTGHNANSRITGWYGSYIGSNTWMMYTTTNNGTGGTIDDTNIVQAINRIYDWLDNADLATNNTIINVVNNANEDVNNANGLYDLVRSIFKTAYGNLDDGTNVSDWTSASNYFGNLWSDPEP